MAPGAAIAPERRRHEVEIRGFADRDAHLEFEHVGGHGVLVPDEAGFERGAAGRRSACANAGRP